MKIRNRKLICLLTLLVGFNMLLLSQTNIKTMNADFPKEVLDARLNKIISVGGENISFNSKLIENVEVPALKAPNVSVETVLIRTLETTSFTYKKVSGGSYVIIKKDDESPKHSGLGTLKGRIVESETSEPIIGASVRLSDKQYTITDINGYYTFPRVPGGKLTMDVSYVGFKPEKTEINVKAGENIYDIKMSGSTTLGEVRVSGVRRLRSAVPHTTEKLMVAEIKGLTVLASGISSEQISKTADRNAAQAVQRIAGVSIVDDKFVIVRGLNPRYNLTYLNDNTAPSTETNSRAFALDLIPSRIIDKIVVQKSPSPENQGDATGGVVKIYTKDAKSVRHFDMEFQLGIRPGTSFNNNFLTYKGGSTDFLGFDDGTRALPSSVPGYGSLVKAQLTPSQYAKTFNSTLSYGNKTALPNMQFTLNYYNAFRLFHKTLSSLTSLSYKNENQKAEMYRQQGIGTESFETTDKMGDEDRNTNTVQTNLLQNFKYSFNDSSSISFKNFVLIQGIDATIVRNSQSTYNLVSNEDYSRDKDIILSYNQRLLYVGNLGGTHSFGKQELKWNGGYNFSRQETPDQRVIRMTGIDPQYTVGDADLQWRARGYNPKSTDSEVSIPLSLGIISRIWSRNSEGVYNGSFDYSYKIKPWLTVKAGTFNQWKSRAMDRRIYTVHEANISDPDAVPPLTLTGYVNPALVRFRLQDLANVWSSTYLNDNYTGLKVYDRTSGSDTYRGTEQNNSGYFLLNFTPANRFVEIYGGLRYEYNRQKIAAAIPPGNSSSLNIPILIDNPTQSWLPSLNISVRPSDRFVGRLAYGKTVNRTEFREVSPFKELDFENNVILSGNPDLVSATVNNYDARIEFYPAGSNTGDLISVGIFYKDITRPIERIITSSRAESVFNEISYANATSATIKGLEVELRKSLSFIPGSLFRNLSVIANGSFIKSKVHLDADLTAFQITDRPLQGQAPYIINAGLYYENSDWGSKVSVIYNVSGESIYAAGRGYKSTQSIKGSEYRGSLIELPRHMLDFSYTQRVAKSVQMKFSVQNLLNQWVRIAEDYNFTNKYEPLKVTKTAAGVQIVEGDNISSQYNPGRYFTLSVSYSL